MPFFKKYNLLRANNGSSAIIMTIMVMLIIMTVNLTMAQVAINGVIMNRTGKDAVKAYYAAESGVERVLWLVREKNLLFSSVANGDYLIFDQTDTVDDAYADNEFTSESDLSDCVDNSNCQIELTNHAKYSVQYKHDNVNSIDNITAFGGFGTGLDEVGRAVQASWAQ